MANRKRVYCALGYQCNNRCLICAVDSETNRNRNISTEELCRYFDRFSGKDGFEFEISGGEPTIRPDFLYLINYLRSNSPKNPYILLSNGRRFSDTHFTSRVSEMPPKSILIAIHGDTQQIHDTQTQVRGSFNETVVGVRNLFDYGLNVDLKIIVTKLNFTRLPELVQFAAQTFPNLRHMSINGLDVQGTVLRNKERVFVPIRTAKPYIQKALDSAMSQGISIRTYSLPVCLFDDPYRQFIGEQPQRNLICKSPTTETDSVAWTQGTIDKCSSCKYRSFCSGTWYSYFDNYGTEELTPVLEDGD